MSQSRPPISAPKAWLPGSRSRERTAELLRSRTRAGSVSSEMDAGGMVRRGARALRPWARGHLVLLLGALLVLLLAGWGAGELIVSRLTPADVALVRDVAAWRTSIVMSVARVVSWGGNVVVIGPLAVLVCVTLGRRDRRSAAIVALSSLGALVIFNGDKLLVGRRRPPVSHLAPVVHSSFPSGHATMSGAFYLALLIVFLSRTHHRISAVVAAAAATLTILAIDFARLYLGVHYLSDVAAGALLGATWAGTVALALRSRGSPGPH